MPSTLKQKIIAIFRPLWAFGAIGGGAAIIYPFVNVVALSYLEYWPKPIVSVITYSLFIFPVYWLQRKFAFNSKAAHKTALPRYLLTQIIALVLNFVFAALAFNIWQLPHLYGSFLAIILTSIASFVFLKFWVFRE